MPQPQQCQIQAVSATYTTAHSNNGSLTHWARPGIDPPSSWIIVGFVNCWALPGTPGRSPFIFDVFGDFFFLALTFYFIFMFLFFMIFIFSIMLIYRVLSISTVQQSDPILHTFFFSHSPPSCSLASDWIQFPVLRSRRSADSSVNVAFVNMVRTFHVCFCFCFCFAFLEPHLWHRARGWIRATACQLTPQPWQHQIQAAAVNYTPQLTVTLDP